MGIDDVFAVIAEGTRRQILETLREGDRAVGELVIELQVSQPTVSKHLKVLREAGLVSMRAQGQKRFYSLETAPLDQVQAWLSDFGARTDPTDVAAPGSVDVAVDSPSDAAPVEVGEAPAPGSVVVPMSDPKLEPGPDVLAAAVLAGHGPTPGVDAQRPIGRTMGRAAERAADLISQLRRRRDPSADR